DNTINNLTTQEAQVACFCNAGKHLAPGGCFVIETTVPPLRDIPHGQSLLARQADGHAIVTDSFDHTTQSYVRHYVDFTDGERNYHSVPFRYVWPSELDLMAEIAGLRLL